MDILDRRILAAVQSDATIKAADLAEHAGTSRATANRRLRALRDAGIVERIVAIVSKRFRKQRTGAIIGIRLVGNGDRHQSALKKFLANHSAVRFAWKTTGEFDYIAFGLFDSLADYDERLLRALEAHHSVDGFRTFECLDEICFDPSCPVASDH